MANKLTEQAVPNFLALLERGAAQRYREWAEQLQGARAWEAMLSEELRRSA